MRIKETNDIKTVNDMINKGWLLSSVCKRGNKVEFILVLDEQPVPKNKK